MRVSATRLLCCRIADHDICATDNSEVPCPTIRCVGGYTLHSYAHRDDWAGYNSPVSKGPIAGPCSSNEWAGHGAVVGIDWGSDWGLGPID